MEFNDRQAILLTIFNDEFEKFERQDLQSRRYQWVAFINSKSLGITFDYNKSGRWAKEYVYKVVDEKKWVLTKLKYGI